MRTLNNVLQAETELLEVLGYEEMYNALSKAIGTDELESMLAYIARCYDIELSVDIEE